MCARLNHPCIVQVRGFLEEPGISALVFEYVPGVALGRVLRLCQSAGARLPDASAWHIVERVAAALAYAHAFRDEGPRPTPIVHRDVSPSNVLLDWSGGVKLTDFGLAKVLGVSPGTRLGIVKGTLGCMAPEQARGDAVDERADVYAAGLLAWRLATGRLPFGRHHRDDWELLRAMRNPHIRPLSSLRPDLPRPLLDAVARALEPEPVDRTLTARELGDVVRATLDLDGGRAELGRLLRTSRGALERNVKRLETTRASGEVAGDTIRYEEVALAFDEEPEADAVTVQTFALPSDPSVLAALPVVPDGDPPEVASPVPPPLEVEAPSAPPVAPAPARRGPRPRARARGRTALWLAAVVVLALGAVMLQGR